LAALSVLAPSQTVLDVGAGPHARAQAIADEIRSAGDADMGVIGAGMLKRVDGGGDLSGLIAYPSEEIVVIRVPGSGVREAMERSIANLPDSNDAFLQISGLSVWYSASATAGSRVLEIRVGDAALDPSRQYTIAMPASLAHGALGYFKVWDKRQIVKNTGTKLEAALKNKTGAVRSPRYISR
jgi:2',3'-cyclic-nucleotide 2'-phosphodiesterase (5'-nucleotidase family)